MKTLKNHKHYIHQKKNPKKTTQKKKNKNKKQNKKNKTKQKQKDKIEKVSMTHLVKLDPPQEKEFERSMSV